MSASHVSDEHRRGIVKIQRQLTEPRDATVLITSDELDLIVLQPMPPWLLAWFGDAVKFYAEVDIWGDSIMLLEKVAPEQQP